MDARSLCDIVDDGQAHLVVTSPPYPMIEMWDNAFARNDPAAAAALDDEDGPAAFELMHSALDIVWDACRYALCDGGIACVNIGDAVRTLGGQFSLYSNHARIVRAFLLLGFQALPAIIWRKQTNAPNKFMGSGMLPPGAYVTLEHEFILVFRKGGKRTFSSQETARRRQSAFFWEERNAWFSDVWFDLKGTAQKLGSGAGRERSGAFPFELPWRLIHMFSIQGDTVVDPFLGTGTTLAAAAAAARNSIGIELNKSLAPVIRESALAALETGNRKYAERLAAHREFAAQRIAQGKDMKHAVRAYGMPCVSKQETDIRFPVMQTIKETRPGRFQASYAHDAVPDDSSSQTELF
jgi:DNA modification methylase